MTAHPTETRDRAAREDADARALQRVASGDKAAFRELYDRNQGRVLRFALRFVSDSARAEELTQEIFVKLYRHAASYRPTATFTTFLFRVASNHCLNELRRGEYRQTRVDGDDQPLAPKQIDLHGPDAALEGSELERVIHAALLALGDRERAAFSMARFEGMAYREIAEALGASEAATKSLIHRATLAVAKRIDAHQSAVSAAGSGS